VIKRIYNERVLLARFVAVGIIGFIVNYSVLRLCTGSIGLNKIAGEIIAAIIALQVTFLLNDNWTYKLENSRTLLTFKLWQRYIAYMSTNTFGSIMTVVLFAIFSNFLARLPALAFAAMAAMIWNYIMNKLLIWRRSYKHDE